MADGKYPKGYVSERWLMESTEEHRLQMADGTYSKDMGHRWKDMGHRWKNMGQRQIFK